jgi:hypothetical protein
LAQNTAANAGLDALVVSAASWQVHSTVSSLVRAQASMPTQEADAAVVPVTTANRRRRPP